MKWSKQGHNKVKYVKELDMVMVYVVKISKHILFLKPKKEL